MNLTVYLIKDFDSITVEDRAWIGFSVQKNQMKIKI